MHTTLPFVLLCAALCKAQMNIACNSFGISDGYQGHDKWRGHDEHCQIAIDKLMTNFGQPVPASEHGCTLLSEFETCQVSICDDYNVRRTVSYETVWAAAHVVHARHRGGNTVAGYVSLDDYTLGGNLFRSFVLVAAPGVPDPHGKRKRAISERRDMLTIRASDDHEFDLNEEPVPNTDDLNINVQAGWGNAEWAPNDQMQNAMENLLVMWDNGDDQCTTLRPAGYLAPNNIMIEFEFAAHQFNAANAVHYQERATCCEGSSTCVAPWVTTATLQLSCVVAAECSGMSSSGSSALWRISRLVMSVARQSELRMGENVGWKFCPCFVR